MDWTLFLQIYVCILTVGMLIGAIDATHMEKKLEIKMLDEGIVPKRHRWRFDESREI